MKTSPRIFSTKGGKDIAHSYTFQNLSDLPEAFTAPTRTFSYTHRMLHVRPSRGFKLYKTISHFTNIPLATSHILFILHTPHVVLTTLHLAPGPKSTSAM